MSGAELSGFFTTLGHSVFLTALIPSVDVQVPMERERIHQVLVCQLESFPAKIWNQPPAQRARRDQRKAGRPRWVGGQCKRQHTHMYLLYWVFLVSYRQHALLFTYGRSRVSGKCTFQILMFTRLYWDLVTMLTLFKEVWGGPWDFHILTSDKVQWCQILGCMDHPVNGKELER